MYEGASIAVAVGAPFSFVWLLVPFDKMIAAFWACQRAVVATSKGRSEVAKGP